MRVHARPPFRISAPLTCDLITPRVLCPATESEIVYAFLAAILIHGPDIIEKLTLSQFNVRPPS